MVAAPPPSAEPGRLGRYLTGAFFLAPAILLLGVWMVYPAVYTIIRSFFGQQGFLGTWVGIDNYRHLFTTSTLTTAIKNNAIWVAVVPGARHRVRADLRGAHRARALGGRVQDRRLPADGDLGVRHRRHLADHVPAGSEPRRDQRARAGRSTASFSPAGVLSSALPVDADSCRPRTAAIVLKTPLHPGGVALLGLTGDSRRTQVPKSAVQAVEPTPKAGDIVGVVWRDFKPGGGKPGVVEKGELGLPGVTVELRDSAGKAVQSAKTKPDGTFDFAKVPPGTYKAGDRRADVREAVRRLLLARAEADHAVAPDRLHLDLGRASRWS